MTSQQPDILINDHSIDLGWLEPYFVTPADRDGFSDTGCFPVKPSFPAFNPICTSLWRGYIATLRLHSDGRLELVKYEFPSAPDGTPPQICNSFFTGEFSMTLRPFFVGPDTTIPFRDGTIVVDRGEWEIDDQTLMGVVTRVLKDSEAGEPFGLMVDIDFPAFVPRSLVPAKLRENLDALVGRSVDCLIYDIDEARGYVALKIIGCTEPFVRAGFPPAQKRGNSG